MPVPTDPYNFSNGSTADADEVDARFLPLYTALNAALDDANVAAAGFSEEALTAALMERLGISSGGAVRRGKATAGAEARTNVAYGLLATPDQVDDVVLAADGLIVVSYRALWRETVPGASRAAIFLGGNQIKKAQNTGAPVVQEATNGGAANLYTPLTTDGAGLVSETSNIAGDASFVTTGQLLATSGGSGLAVLEAAAGTYDVSVQFKASSGTVTVTERKLRVFTIAL